VKYPQVHGTRKTVTHCNVEYFVTSVLLPWTSGYPRTTYIIILL